MSKECRDPILLFVFIRSLHPDKRLKINHVARLQVTKILANDIGKGEQACIRLPRGPRRIVEIIPILPGCNSCDVRFQETMHIRPGDEAEYRYQWPGKHASLLPRKRSNRVAPSLKPGAFASCSMQEVKQLGRKHPRADQLTDSVAKSH